MGLQYVKVFGERNTGTNLLEDVLRRQTDLQVLSHVGTVQEARRQMQVLLQSPNPTPLHVETRRRLYRYVIEDHLLSTQFCEHFGWKHGAVQRCQLETASNFARTLFVCITRDPYKFIASLYRRPYQLEPDPAVHASLLDFINAPILLFPKDNLPARPILDSPVQLWNLKTRSYALLARQLPRQAITLSYEELIASPVQTLAPLGEFCALSANPVLAELSTKGDDKTLEQYRREAIDWRPRYQLGDAVVDAINCFLDAEVMAMTGYSCC